MKRILISVGLAAGVTAVAVGLLLASEERTAAHRIALLLGGDVLNGGYIQYMTFAAFFWALFEIRERTSRVAGERRAFGLGLLPEKEHYVVSLDDVRRIQKEAIAHERSTRNLLTTSVRRACTKFIRTRSVAEVIDLVGQQAAVDRARSESDQSVIRYLLWAIPSIGFIGTVIGISLALASAYLLLEDPDNLTEITRLLGVAFDTTLVALVLNLIAMWFFHRLQARQEDLHSDIEEHILENFVNRISEE